MLSIARPRGFTLVELLVVMVVLSIFATLAVATFEGPLRKARRTQALVALAAAQLAQETWRLNQREYDPKRDLATLRSSRANDFYDFVGDIPAKGSAANSYRFAATARAASSQARDRGCQFLGIEVVEGQVQRIAGVDAASATPGPMADGCWGRS